jgi:two-component system, NarL family, sensor histidine kinase UhpB
LNCNYLEVRGAALVKVNFWGFRYIANTIVMTTLSRNIILYFIPLISSFVVNGQRLGNIDSLKKTLQEQNNDTNKVKLLYTLSQSYVAGSYADTALFYSQQAIDLAEKLNYEPGIFWSEIMLGEALAILGNYPLALEYNFKALTLAKKLNDPLKLCYGNGGLSSCYYYMGEYDASIKYMLEVIRIMDSTNVSTDKSWMWAQLSRAFYEMEQPDSALLYAKKAYEMIEDSQSLYRKSFISPVLGNAYAAKAIYDSALLYYQMGIPLSIKRHTQTHLIDNYYGIVGVYKSTGNPDSAIWYAEKIINEPIIKTYPAGLLKAANILADIYQSKNKPDSALKYLNVSIAIKDSLFNRQKTIAVQNLIYKEQEKQKAIEAYKLKFKNQLRIYALIAGLLASIILGGIWLRNRRQKQIQSIRNSIADDLHDDIGSTLSSIAIMSELAKTKSPEASTLMASISESATFIQENMSDIVWAIKSENDSFENVLQRVNQFASEISDAKNMVLDFESDESLSDSKLTMKQRKSFYLFFKEAVNNAAKHSGAKRISVCILKKDHHAEMIIRDNGIGFDVNQTFGGNGMSTLKKRAEELNGDFEIQSHLNNGTVVKLRFKIT